MGTLHITLFSYRTRVYLTVIDIKNTKTQKKKHFQSVFTNNSMKNYFFLKKVIRVEFIYINTGSNFGPEKIYLISGSLISGLQIYDRYNIYNRE